MPASKVASRIAVLVVVLALTPGSQGFRLLIGSTDFPKAGSDDSPIQPSVATTFLPSTQRLVNATQFGGSCGPSWTDLSQSDTLDCSYGEVDLSSPDQLGVVLLPDGTIESGWTNTIANSRPNCANDTSAYDELDDGADINDGDQSCRQGSINGSRVAVSLTNPFWNDAADVDDFTVTTSAVVTALTNIDGEGPRSMSLDLGTGGPTYVGTTFTNANFSYIRYTRADSANPLSGTEWTVSDINNLVLGTRCVDCHLHNHRVTQIQAKVDARYNAEFALEVQFLWRGVDNDGGDAYLVVECRQRTAIAEHILVQVGQGGTLPTSWRTAYMCSEAQDASFESYRLSALELDGGEPVVRFWDAQRDEPDDTIWGNFTLNVVRIDIVPTGLGILGAAEIATLSAVLVGSVALIVFISHASLKRRKTRFGGAAPPPERTSPPVPPGPQGGGFPPPPEEELGSPPPSRIPPPSEDAPKPKTPGDTGGARYVNVCFTPAGPDGLPLPQDTSLKMGRTYGLRIHIGDFSAHSIVENQEVSPLENLPPTDSGLWLQLAVLSNDFVVQSHLRPLFLPHVGTSWVCDCAPGRDHRCNAKTRRPYCVVEVTAPRSPGTARLRICLYYRNNLVQSQLLSAEIATEERKGAGHKSRIDYTLSSRLRDLRFLTPRAVNILTNENPDRTHTVIFKNGAEETLSLTMPDLQIRSAILGARKTLFDIHVEEFGGTWGTGRQRKNLFDENNSKDKEHFVEDLKKLCFAGWNLWCALRYQSPPDEANHLLAFMAKSGKTIQVARVHGSSFVFPWALVYDINLESDPSQWKLCKVLDTWDQAFGRESTPEAGCPFQETHDLNVICPYGFWGLRHIIEQPPSSGTGNLPISIRVSGAPEVLISSSLDLDRNLTGSHLRNMSTLFRGFTVVEADSRDQIRKALANPTLEIVYFYCHGKREEQPGGAVAIPYLEIGDGEKVKPTDITAWQISWSKANLSWETTPLVFINGCHTTELSPELLVNFVDAFGSANAGGVIGTEISIDQRIANEAAEQFFSHFENQEPVGRALHRVRLGFLRKGNLLGLAYTPYCSADLCLSDA